MRIGSYSLLIMGSLSSLGACHGGASEPPIDLGSPRQLVYIADDLTRSKHGGAAARSAVHVFEATTMARVGQFDGGDGIGELHGTPDGDLLWMVASTEGTVTLLDTVTYDVVELDVGIDPVHSFISPEHTQIWVGNDGSADVSVIDLLTRTVARTVLTGSGHHKMAMVGTSGGFGGAYVSNLGDSSITPVDQNGVVRTNVAGVGPSPHGMDYSSVLKQVLNCSGDASNSVEVIATVDDTSTPANERDTIIARVPLPSRCAYLHVTDDGQYAVATLSATNQLARIRLVDRTVDLFDTGAYPDRFEIVNNRAYVANVLEPTISVVDMGGVAATVTVPVGNAVRPGATEGRRAIRFDHHRSRMYVVNGYDGTVTVVSTLNDTVVATLADMHEPVAVAIVGPGYGTTYPR